MPSPTPNRRWSPFTWFVGGLLLIALAAILGLGAAQLVATGQAVPTVDPSRLLTPSPSPNPTASTRPSATPAPTASPPPTASASAAPTATPTASASAGATPRTHVVARGETLSIIAAQYGTTVDAIVALNNLANPNHIEVGQVLLIPPP